MLTLCIYNAILTHRDVSFFLLSHVLSFMVNVIFTSYAYIDYIAKSISAGCFNKRLIEGHIGSLICYETDKIEYDNIRNQIWWYIIFLAMSHFYYQKFNLRLWIKLLHIFRHILMWQQITGLNSSYLLRCTGIRLSMMTSSNGSISAFHRSPVNSPHNGQWRGTLMFSLIWAWINCWVNNREAGDLRRHRAHYDVRVMHGCFEMILH